MIKKMKKFLIQCRKFESKTSYSRLRNLVSALQEAGTIDNNVAVRLKDKNVESKEPAGIRGPHNITAPVERT